jgi:uncharacterized membrane protein
LTTRTYSRDWFVHAAFTVGVVAKAIDGVLEVLGGVLLFVLPPDRFYAIVWKFTQHELSTDPSDVVAHYLLNGVQHLTTGTKTFAAIYLFWHGLVKIGLVGGLLLKRRWAYPLAIAAFAIFVLYQLYRYSHTHSVGLVVLTVLDILVIVLTWLEFRRLEREHGFDRARA